MKYSEIIKLNNLLEGQINRDEYKITILSNIMIHQSKDICEYLLRTESLNAKVVLGEYDNIVQDSKKFQDTNAIVLFWEACNFIDGLQFKINLFSDHELEELIARIKLEIDIVLSALKNTPTVIINRFSSLIFDQFNLSESNLKRLSNVLNIYLESSIGENVTLFNIDGVISRLSIKSAIDLRYYYSSKTLYSIDFYREYFKNIQHIFFAANGKTKKALIFDCDNTLWKGVLGEDGFDGIKIYQEVQYLALQLSKKGVIIGLCSKNNPEDVDNVLKNHPDMILKDSDIVIKKVNWDNKVLNLQSISEDLNIGIDSLVFMDDSSFEIELIKQELPAVKVFQVPAKEYEYGLMMNQVANLYFSPAKTKEDSFKTQMYKDQTIRSKAKNKTVDIESYLTSLGIVITVHLDNLNQVSRITQLTQKTNQFNLTTQRYTESEIKSFILSNDKIVLSIEVSDKYGESGLTGLAILCKKTSKIDTLLLSCRVIGRNIEYKFIDIIVDVAKKNNFKVLKADFIKTHKNSQVEDFYDKCRFDIIRKSIDSSIYSLDIRSFKYKNIKYIEAKHEG
jgi:FkbH-like protein